MTAVDGALRVLRMASVIVKNLKDAEKNIVEDEYKGRLAEVYDALADSQVFVGEMKSELLERDELIHQLNEKLVLTQNMHWKRPFYWVRKETPGKGHSASTVGIAT